MTLQGHNTCNTMRQQQQNIRKPFKGLSLERTTAMILRLLDYADYVTEKPLVFAGGRQLRQECKVFRDVSVGPLQKRQ